VGARHDLQQLVLQPCTGECVERAERLVHQQHLRLHRQGPGNAHALLHAARDFAGALLARVFQPDQGQRCGGTFAQLCLAFLASKHALHCQVDVVKAGQPGQQGMVLEHHGALGAGALDFLVGAQQGACGGRGQPGNQVQQCGFAAA